ncbi:MT-A70 family methyltransferase [Sphingorhabdus pulchriflava]|uniref:MT-A70 family methyltransferase n=1 Tax=Sphingorhabdus pulchriflava TaxID=2292257 RepID=UPI001C697D2C|nr:MT-A70 family methyltransferase [Sphingorhabdus pulchriflava]
MTPALSLSNGFLPRTDYQLLLADPAWAFRTHSGQNRTPTQKKFGKPASGSGSFSEAEAEAEAEDHYPTMDVKDMMALPVAEHAAPNALLAMWVVGSHIDVAIELGRAWGFTYTTDLFYWVKLRLVDALQVDMFSGDIPEPRMSMGYHSRKQIEPCLLFTRGKGLPVLDHGVRQLIIESPREHSRKPAEQYRRLDRLYGTHLHRAELFARTSQPGWDVWGNETDKFETEELA